MGRVIYSEDPNNPVPEEKRPVVIDLANNTLRVDIDKDIKRNTERDDLDLLTTIVDWVKEHNEMPPNIKSTNKKERMYAATLYRIQNKYGKYLEGYEEFPELEEDKIERIENIINVGGEIDLWNMQLEIGDKEKVNKVLNVENFEVRGILRDFVELDREVEEIEGKSTIDRFIEDIEKLQSIDVDTSQIRKKDTIASLAERSGVSIEQVEEAGLDPNKKIGVQKDGIVGASRGNGRI